MNHTKQTNDGINLIGGASDENLEIRLKESGAIKRLTNRTFKFDERIASGFFTARYFLKINEIIKTHKPNQQVTMQDRKSVV